MVVLNNPISIMSVTVPVIPPATVPVMMPVTAPAIAPVTVPVIMPVTVPVYLEEVDNSKYIDELQRRMHDE